MSIREHFDAELAGLRSQLHALGTRAADAVAQALDALAHNDGERARQVIGADGGINAAQRELENHAVNLIATQQPVARDLRGIIATISAGAELERIADYAKGIARLVVGADGAAPLEPTAELLSMGAAALAILRNTLRALDAADQLAARAVAAEEEQIDRLYGEVKRGLALRVPAAPADVVRNADLFFVAHSLERIADRATNIAERVIYMSSGAVVELNP